MDDLINGTVIDLDCAECGGIVKTTIGTLRRSPLLRCANGHEIPVDGSKFNVAALPSDRALNSLDRTLENFGK